MRILIAAIGRLKDPEERAIVARYAQRFDQTGKSLSLGPLAFVELPEGKADNAPARKADEAGRLIAAAGKSLLTVVLDGGGKLLSSDTFAKFLQQHADAGAKACSFLIGGPDGHGEATLRASTLTLSLGPMTLPHGLARIVLTEQLYRSATILAGHPYHRA